MSQGNVEEIRAAFEAMAEAWAGPAERRTDLAERYFDPDIEWHEDPKWPGSSVHRGREATIAGMGEALDILGMNSFSVEDVIAAGDAAVVFVTARGQSAKAQIPNEFKWALVARVRDGRLLFVRVYLDESEALEAAGVAK
jgi:ketosteroid isomerase-like protein